jgi:hypothetical protein
VHAGAELESRLSCCRAGTGGEEPLAVAADGGGLEEQPELDQPPQAPHRPPCALRWPGPTRPAIIKLHHSEPAAIWSVAKVPCNLTPRHPPRQVVDNLPRYGG